MATLFIDYENGNDNYGGTSFSLLGSGTDGRISSYTFSSASASFSNNGTLCNTKNLLVGSERLLEISFLWGTLNATIAASSIAKPSGFTGNVYLLTETTGSGSHYFANNFNNQQYFLTTGDLYTFSAYVKANGRNEITLKIGTSGAVAGARYNLSNGTVVSGSGATGTITSIGDGWYRVGLSLTVTESNQTVLICLTDDTYTGTAAQTYTGNGVSGIYIAGLQLEAGTSVTSYENLTSHFLSIFNGTSYVTYEIGQILTSTSLLILRIETGTALANQSVDRQYYIGGRWKTLSTGATAARIAPGDTMRLMASPDPTSIGNATWTSSMMQATKALTSTSNTTPIVVTAANHGYVTGDTVIIYDHTVNTNANGTWEITVTGTNTFTLNGSTGNGAGTNTGALRLRNNDVIKLPVSLTENIASFGNRGNGRTAWTASTNVTVTLDSTDYKEGDVSDSIAIGASFTTGKAAYKATASTLDLGGYQQVSFWIKQTSGTVSVYGDISLRLCTDTIGDTSVHTINIPGLVVLSRWTPITVNLATNLNDSIKSIALYVDADKGAQTFLISNIIACKASSSNDSINLCSLLSKNTTNEPWWPIQSINGTRIMIDDETNITQKSTGLRGYYGVSETTTTYKLEPIKRPYTVGAITALENINKAGAFSASINIIGGWDRTNMSTRSGYTWLDGGNGNGYIISSVSGKNYINFSYFGFTRCNAGLYIQSNVYGDISNIYGCACTLFPLYLYATFKNNITNIIGSTSSAAIHYGIQSAGSIFNNIVGISNRSYAFHSSYSPNAIINNIIGNNNGNSGIVFEHSNTNIVTSGIFYNNVNYGIYFAAGAANNFAINCVTSGSLVSGTAQGQGNNYLKNCIIYDSAEFGAASPFSDGRIISMNHDNTVDNHIIFTDYGLIRNTTSIRQSNSGFAWVLSPTNDRRDSTYPLDFPVGKVAVNANQLVTIKAWVRRSDTRLVMGLRLKGGQIAGVPNDITSYMTAGADTWEQITLTFTPTEIGVVEILAECYGGTTYNGYIDNLTITQV